MGCPDAELSILLVEDEEIARLNREYLNREGPTNVISFPMLDPGQDCREAEMIGDVVISPATTARQAEGSGFSPLEMLDFYLIHGILHLVGYDHEESREAADQMEEKTWELFDLLGHEESFRET